MIVPARSDGTARALESAAGRAELLARSSTIASEPLLFAAGLLRAQAKAAAAIAAVHAEHPLTGRLSEDAVRLIARLLDVPRFAARGGPAALAQTARSRAEEDESTARTRLEVFWNGGLGSAEDYLSRAMLRPYVEVLRAIDLAPDCLHGRVHGRVHERGRCPFCGGAPGVGCRRGGADDEGAARFLVCALCGLEWRFSRVRCPGCFEADPHRLPAFTSAEHPGVRIETCETCSRYVKSIDLSLDARPIPEVDDLVSISMDLWASERGLARIEPGLAGI